MNTQVLQVSENSVALAAQLLKNGELVAIPTETVYGLAASSLNSNAVKDIFLAKGRPQDNPLISHISSMQMLDKVAQNIPQSAYVLAQQFWPGALTMVLPRADCLADEVCAGLSTAAVRMPSHKGALAIISACGFPLAAPSANISGSPSPTTAQHVLDDMNKKIPLIIDGGACSVGVESTVISLVGKVPMLLRPGGITLTQLEAALQCKVELSNAVLHALKQNESAASPGMKYKHYSPKASLVLVKGSLDKYNSLMSDKAHENAWRLCFVGEESSHHTPCVTYGRKNAPREQASRLFAALRELDDNGARTVFVRCPKQTGEALAVYNRLLRAAAFEILEL